MTHSCHPAQHFDSKFLPKFQGCLVGGAAGDALGFTVEFMLLDEIRATFGPQGITEYLLTADGHKALFSDDTQMTLFTADALLLADTRAAQGGEGVAGERAAAAGAEAYAAQFAAAAYKDWLHTQDPRYTGNPGVSWLLDVPELHDSRGPGRTCLTAIAAGCNGTIDAPCNNSKGCGGVMRIAPSGLFFDTQEAAHQAAALAALTHGHPLGYISAAAGAYIINRCAFEVPAGATNCGHALTQIVTDCCAQLPGWFHAHANDAAYQAELLIRALDLAQNGKSDTANILQLGGGWVGEETLAIAVYAARRHANDFGSAICAAVNHDGDSDSTGAVCGNIMGAMLGIDEIGEEWTSDLEIYDVIMEVAADLHSGCPADDASPNRRRAWLQKYAPTRSEANAHGALGASQEHVVDARGDAAAKQNKTQELIVELYGIVSQLESMYNGRKFTLDGHLVGSLGEVYAQENYQLDLYKPSAELHDAITTDGTNRQVQIKATQGKQIALSVERAPEYLLVFSIGADGSFTEIYNGPGQQPFDAAGKEQKTSQKPIRLSKLAELNQHVSPQDRIRKKLGQ
jgi:ADP-ribosylglycohydrolase